MHGGNSPGAPKGKANGNYRSGGYTKEHAREVALLRILLSQARETLDEI